MNGEHEANERASADHLRTTGNGTRSSIEQGQPGWSIYGPHDVIYPGSEAVVWLNRKEDADEGPWVLEMFVNQFATDDANDYTAHELRVCPVPLAEALRDVINDQQYDEHPQEAEALLSAGQAEGSLSSLRDILVKALAYVDAVISEPRQDQNP